MAKYIANTRAQEGIHVGRVGGVGVANSRKRAPKPNAGLWPSESNGAKILPTLRAWPGNLSAATQRGSAAPHRRGLPNKKFPHRRTRLSSAIYLWV